MVPQQTAKFRTNCCQQDSTTAANVMLSKCSKHQNGGKCLEPPLPLMIYMVHRSHWENLYFNDCLSETSTSPFRWPTVLENYSKTSADSDVWCSAMWTSNLSLFYGHFPGGPGLDNTRMSPFWILLQLRVTEVVVTAGAIRHAKLLSNSHHQQTNTQCAMWTSKKMTDCWCKKTQIYEKKQGVIEYLVLECQKIQTQ